MAKQQVLHPSRRTTTLASLGLAALVAALLGIAWTISTRMYTPITSSPASVSVPVAREVQAGAPAANRFFADEIAGASAQYADAAMLTEALPERLQDVRRPAAPAAPVSVDPTNRFFADEIAGASAQVVEPAILTDPLPERLQDVRRPAVQASAPAAPVNVAPANRFFADEMLGNGGVLLQTDSGLPYVTPLFGPR